MTSEDAFTPETLTSMLGLLCAQPSVTGQQRALVDAADAVASVLRDAGLTCAIVKTPGAPIVIGQYHSGTAPTLLLYGHYDIPAAGLRRTWNHDPFQPTIHDDALWSRGAVVKAEIVARAAALRALIDQRVPLNICFVVEGEALAGSPHLRLVRHQVGDCDMGLWSGGSLDAHGVPLLYTGVKGLLQVTLTATAASSALPATYAATVANPLWTLVTALGSIKSEFEEILLEGFYDEVEPPTRAALDAMQHLEYDEAGRRSAWQIERFVTNVSGRMLARTETFSPTCNISLIDAPNSGAPSIPPQARAEIEFQLVPNQQPDHVFVSLIDHLKARGFDRLDVVRKPGSYAPLMSPPLPFSADRAAVSHYGRPAQIVPIAPFTAPADVLTRHVPFISCGLERPTSALFGPNEHVPIADLVGQTRLLTELITRMAV